MLTSTADALLLVLIVLVALIVGGAVGAWITRRRHRAHGAARSAADSSAEHRRDLVESTTADGDSGQASRVPPRPRAAIIINPTKEAAASFARDAGAICRREGWDAPLILETSPDDPGHSMTVQAMEAGVDLVVAAGGDGTVRAAAEALAGTDVPLGIVPMGTGNLLARNLGIVLDRPEWALRIALWGKDDLVDVARARFSPDGKAHGFMVMAGLGFDAAVMADTNSELKSKVGWLAYLEAGSRKLAGQRTKVRVTVDADEPYVTKIRSIIGGNCGKLQGGVMLLPEAELDDGILDIIVISPKNMTQWLGVAASILGKQKGKGIHTDIHRCRRIVIEAEEPIEVQLDGDAAGSSRYLEMLIEEHALVVRTATREQTRLIRAEGRMLPVR